MSSIHCTVKGVWWDETCVHSYSSYSTSVGEKGHGESLVSHLIIGQRHSIKTVIFLLGKAGPPGVCRVCICHGSSAFARGSLLCHAWRNPAGTADCPYLASA